MDSDGVERIVFMGTPSFAVPTLRALITKGFHLVGVYTQPDRPSGRGRGVAYSPVKGLAMEYGLKIYQPASLEGAEALAGLRSLEPKVIVVAAYGIILPQQVLALPPCGTLNVHPSLLPRYRGPTPIANAILGGDEITGVTIMLVEPRVDAGPVVSSASVRIGPKDTAGALTDRLARTGADLLAAALPRWLRGEIEPQPQDEAQATYSRLISKKDGEIDWRLPAVEIWRRVRAFDPWPGSYTHWKGKLLKVLETRPMPGNQKVEYGRVIHSRGEDGQVLIGVGTGEGVLSLKRIQLEGRKAVGAGGFILGYRDFVGAQLPS